MPAILLAPVLGAFFPLAAEVDFTHIPVPALFPRDYRYTLVVGSDVRTVEHPVEGCNAQRSPAEWAAKFAAVDLMLAGASGGVATVTRLRGRPVTRVEVWSPDFRVDVRWAVRPDHLADPPPEK